MKLRDYQAKIVDKVWRHFMGGERVAYLSLEVRTGKTLTALAIADKIITAPSEKLLFITTKKAIDMGGIAEDYKLLSPKYAIEFISMDSIHKADHTPNNYAVIIADESHAIGGSYPKPSKRAEALRHLLSQNKYAFYIMLSGTPSPETKSQLFHQFWVSTNHPYSLYSFYQWAKINVNVKKKYVGTGVQVNDYTECRDLPELDKYFFTATQKDAGFKTEVKEKVIYLPMPDNCKNIKDKLLKDKVVRGSKGVILADTGVKMQNKIHQISSGTVILEEGEAVILSDYKAQFIKDNFEGRLVIFYIFKAEWECIKAVLGDEVSDTKETKHIALQIQSGARAVTLSEYDAIVYYNIAFSAELYWQSRNRMSAKDREVNEVFWLFSNEGIESKVYKAVQKKKDYTLQYFKRDYEGKSNTIEDYTLFGE
jgi:hypothetical protein